MFIVEKSGDSGSGTLRDAIAKANNSLDRQSVINFVPDIGTIKLTSGTIDITSNIKIIGEHERVIIEQNSAISSHFTINVQCDYLYLNNIALTNATSSAITVTYQSNNLILENVHIYNNITNSIKASGITTSGNLTILNSEFKNNSAPNGNSTIYSSTFGTSINIDNTLITDNNAYIGGAIYTFGNLEITKSIITNNSTTTASGGGICTKGTLTMTDCTVTNNHSADTGGGIAAVGSMSNITNSTIANNTANNVGGGIASAGVIIDRSTISDNTATNDAGGIYVTGDGKIRNSYVTNNQNIQNGFGSGILINNLNITVEIDSVVIKGNKNGSGVAIEAAENVNIKHCIIENNQTSNNGGGINIGPNGLAGSATLISNADESLASTHSTTNVTIESTIIKQNCSEEDGGGIFNSANLKIIDSRIFDNKAVLGREIYSTGSLTIIRSIIESHDPNDIVQV